MKTVKTFEQFISEDFETAVAHKEEKDLVKAAAKDAAKGQETETEEEEIDAEEIAQSDADKNKDA